MMVSDSNALIWGLNQYIGIQNPSHSSSLELEEHQCELGSQSEEQELTRRALG